VHLLAVPAGVGHHDSGDTLGDGVRVGAHVHLHERFVAELCVSHVDAAQRLAVAHEVLRGGQHLAPA